MKKVRNVQRAGGRLAIIVDDVEEKLYNVLTIDDATGSGALIPSLMIGKKDGQKLFQFLNKNKNSK